jgi:hypothetical protein
MRRFFTRTLLLASVLTVSAAAAFVQTASANYLGGVEITCTSATFSYSTFPDGAQSVLETVFVDGAVAKQTTYNFTGPTGTDTVQFTVPNDGLPHTIEANAYSLTNSTPVFGLPGVVTSTCGSTPPPPSVCTYTKGYYRNHPTATAGVIAGMGGSVKVGSATLSAAQAQAVLNATPSSPGNVTFTSNLLLNLAQQLITAELNVARGSTAPAGVQAAIASANAAITTSIVGSQIQLSTALSTDAVSALVYAIEGFNSASDCG